MGTHGSHNWSLSLEHSNPERRRHTTGVSLGSPAQLADRAMTARLQHTAAAAPAAGAAGGTATHTERRPG